MAKTVAELAKNFDGYRLNDSVSQATQQITIRVDETLNVITFYYVPVFYVQHIQGGQNKWTETYDVKDGFNLTDKVNLKKDGSAVSTGSFLYGAPSKMPRLHQCCQLQRRQPHQLHPRSRHDLLHLGA